MRRRPRLSFIFGYDVLIPPVVEYQIWTMTGAWDQLRMLPHDEVFHA